jgi:hypothetical protein
VQELSLDRLRKLQVLLPPTGSTPTVLDLFQKEEPEELLLEFDEGAGAWNLVAVCNWGLEPKRCRLDVFQPFFQNLATPSGATLLHVFEFWSGEYSLAELDNSSLTLLDPPAVLNSHSALIYAVRPLVPDKPEYVGSDLHFTCGKELASWKELKAGVVVLELDILERSSAGHVWLFLPNTDTKSEVMCSGSAYGGHAVMVSSGVWKIAVTLEGRGGLQVDYCWSL